MTNLLFAMAENWSIMSDVTNDVDINTSFIDNLVENATITAPNVYDDFDLDNENLEDF